jgi:hypothetical protein
MVEPVRSTVRERLSAAVTDAVTLVDRLDAIIATPTSRLGGRGRTGRIDHSQPPWNAPVAHLVLEIHATARYLENDLRDLAGMSWLRRGGDDANTIFALRAIVSLAEAIHDDWLFEPARELGGWCARSLIVLGERDLPQRLPRNVGQAEARCPYCGQLTLRFWSSRGEVRCVNPGCRDGDDRRPVARMDYSPVIQGWVLAWRDGSVGLPPPTIDDVNVGIAS